MKQFFIFTILFLPLALFCQQIQLGYQNIHPGNTIHINYESNKKFKYGFGINYLLNSKNRFFNNNESLRGAYNTKFINHFGANVSIQKKYYTNNQFNLAGTFTFHVNHCSTRAIIAEPKYYSTPMGRVQKFETIITKNNYFLIFLVGLRFEYSINQYLNFIAKGGIGAAKIIIPGFYPPGFGAPKRYSYTDFSQSFGFGISYNFSKK